MWEKPFAVKAIGIEMQSEGTSFALLSYNNNAPKFEGSFSDVKQLYSDGTVDEETAIVSSMRTSDILLRSINVKLIKEKDINATLPFQAEPLLPYPVEEAVLDKIVLEKSSEETRLGIFASRKDKIGEHLQAIAQLEVEPEIVTATPMALAAFAKHYSNQAEPYFIIHLSHLETTCVLMQENLPVAAQACPSLLHQEEKQLHTAARTIFSLSKSINDTTPMLLITGEGSANTDIVNKLESLLKLPSIKLDQPQLHAHALGIGCALMALEGYAGPFINFRKQEHSYPHPWQRFRKPLTLYAALCVALSFSIFFFGKAYLGHRENSIKTEYVSLLADIGKPFVNFEREYRDKNGLPDEVPSPKQLTMEELDRRLTVLDGQIKDTPDLFPLQHNSPFVSDLLAWLSTHPIAIGLNREAGLSIESLSYTLVKRPDQTKKSEKYKVKIELEFSSPTPMQAREFHDALIETNDFIDTKEEIKWSTNRGRYKTSFFLKDKTQYRTR